MYERMCGIMYEIMYARMWRRPATHGEQVDEQVRPLTHQSVARFAPYKTYGC